MGSSARGDQRCVDAGRVLLAVVIYRNDSHFEQFSPENTSLPAMIMIYGTRSIQRLKWS